jgi:diketogulonate reductase-like aldo/keto reductase
MKTVTLPDGEIVPALGQGTWFMDERAKSRADEIEALQRGIEWDLLPWSVRREFPLVACPPVEQARLPRDKRLIELASALGMTPAQLGLVWVLRHEGMIAIPKAAHLWHVEENARATEIDRPAKTVAELDRIFPPPYGAKPLEIL